MMYEVAVIGGGPAAATSARICRRKTASLRLKPLKRWFVYPPAGAPHYHGAGACCDLGRAGKQITQ